MASCRFPLSPVKDRIITVGRTSRRCRMEHSSSDADFFKAVEVSYAKVDEEDISLCRVVPADRMNKVVFVDDGSNGRDSPGRSVD